MAVQSNIFIEQLYQQVELEMLQNIGKVIGNGEGVNKDGVTQWRVAKLSQLGVLRNDQIKVLAKYSGMSVSEITKYINELGAAEIEAFEGRNEALVKAGVGYVPPSNNVYDRLLALEKQSKDVMNMVNTNMLTFSNQACIDILTKASTDVLTGNSTLNQSLIKVAGEWAESGIPAIIDKAGKKWSSEAYISMVLRSTQKNVAVSMQEGRMDDYDIDLIEISSHAGSRPSHVGYQGNIYSRSGKSKKYPALSSTSYGEIDGIVTGINCSHQEYAYVEGVSTKRNEPFDKKESEEKYIQSQRQRHLERNIRKAKKERAMLDSMEVKKEELLIADEKIEKRKREMAKFIKESGRTRRKQRENIVS
ncbi:phage minor capsid protein [Carnobacterium pleistocenium]|uniref:phage minor capsid protein n=1 Tax=Carnobacterium pleistocenium TaxID=181073 RepID=UPI00054E11D9|nr:phage minor capsid protein [Carnobacterium pleistocenium]